jgi:hypothetical protein
MLRMTAVLVGAISAPLVLATFPAMARVANPVMATEVPLPDPGPDYIGLGTQYNASATVSGGDYPWTGPSGLRFHLPKKSKHQFDVSATLRLVQEEQ